MRPRARINLPHTPQSLSALSADAAHLLITKAPIVLYNKYLCPRFSQAEIADEEREECEDDYVEFREAAQTVKQYFHRVFRSRGGSSLQLGKVHWLALREAIYQKFSVSSICYHRSSDYAGEYLYPLFLAKYLIFSEFMGGGVALPMAEMHNTSLSGWLQKIADEEYEIFNKSGPRQWITLFFLSRQCLTKLELGFCDDSILTTIGENLWGLLQLTLTLSHHCSDVGLFRLMYKKVPDEYRIMRQLSNTILTKGGKPDKKMREELTRQIKQQLVNLEELNSFVDRDASKFKMRGCPFLKELTLFGDIGCYGLTEERKVMFRVGLHLVLFECQELTTFEIRLDSVTRKSAGGSEKGPKIANLTMQILGDYQRVTGYVPNLLRNLTVSLLPDLSHEDINTIRDVVPHFSSLNVVECCQLSAFPPTSFQHLSSLMLLRTDPMVLLGLLPLIRGSSLKSLTLGVDFRSSLQELLDLRKGLPLQLRRLHIVFEGPRDSDEKMVLEPNEWISDLSLSLTTLMALHPSTCRDPKMGPRIPNSTLFQEILQNEMLRNAVTRIFAEASPIFDEVSECFFGGLEELELSGLFHWAQGVLFAMKCPDLIAFRFNPKRELEVKNFIFHRDLRMTLLPYLLFLPTRKLRRLTVAGHDDLFHDSYKMQQLLLIFAESHEMVSLEYFSLGRSLYFSCMNIPKFRQLVRFVASGVFQNTFTIDVCHAQFDPLILDAVRVKFDQSHSYVVPHHGFDDFLY